MNILYTQNESQNIKWYKYDTMFYYSLLNSIISMLFQGYIYIYIWGGWRGVGVFYDNMTMTCTPLLPVWWNMSPWPTSKALSRRSPRHRKHQFQFQLSSRIGPPVPTSLGSPWILHGFSWWTGQRMSNVLSDAADVEKPSAIPFSSMFLLSSGCFILFQVSTSLWTSMEISPAMILILQAKEPKHGPDAFSWWTITRVSHHKNCWAMLRLGPTSIRQHMGIPVKCIDADQIHPNPSIRKSMFWSPNYWTCWRSHVDCPSANRDFLSVLTELTSW